MAEHAGTSLQDMADGRRDDSPQFTALFGENWGLTAVVLVTGGLLVGFGTRMAGGCTSGHGLCGVSRAQVGSLVATAGFFGAGIVTALVMGVWL